MADVDQAQATEQAKGADAINGETVQQMISEALAKQAEQTKGEYAGLNRRNSELETMLADSKAKADETLKSTMSESEKAQHEWQLKIEKSTEELTKANRVAELERNKNTAREKLREAKLPDDFMEFIPIESADAIDNAVAKAAELFKKISEMTAEEVGKRLGADAPNPPSANNSNVMKRSAFEALSPKAQMEFIKEGGVPID